MRAAMDDLANRARRHRSIVVIDDAGFDIERRPARRTKFAQLVLGLEHGRERRQFGLSVEIEQSDAGQARDDFADDFARHDRRAVIAFLQRRQIATIEVGVAQQCDPHEIGRAHVLTPVTNATLVCRLLLDKKKQLKTTDNNTYKKMTSNYQ